MEKVGELGAGDKQSAVDEFGKQLAACGFSYHGTEVMYSGLLGTEMPCEIFIGVVYYQRLRHMVGDKYQVPPARYCPVFMLATRNLLKQQ